MTKRCTRLLLAALCCAAIATVGCGDDATPAMDSAVPMDTSTPVACTGPTLCARSLGECGVTSITLADCEGFYEPSTSSCADIAAYTTCNCDCDAMSPTSCGPWFACGETCFTDHCM